MMAEICGTTPLRQHVAQEDVGVARERAHALLNARAAGVVEADDGRAHCIARSMILTILAALVSESDPPKTVKSWAKTKTSRPSMRP